MKRYYRIDVRFKGTRKVEITASSEEKCAEAASLLAENGQTLVGTNVKLTRSGVVLPMFHVEEIDVAEYRRIE